MNNIIYNNNEIIGTIQNIEKFFKEEIKRQINDNLSVEELKENTNKIFDILLEIQENEQEKINNDCLFKIYEHQTGDFIYSVLEERK